MVTTWVQAQGVAHLTVTTTVNEIADLHCVLQHKCCQDPHKQSGSSRTHAAAICKKSYRYIQEVRRLLRQWKTGQVTTCVGKYVLLKVCCTQNANMSTLHTAHINMYSHQLLTRVHSKHVLWWSYVRLNLYTRQKKLTLDIASQNL